MLEEGAVGVEGGHFWGFVFVLLGLEMGGGVWWRCWGDGFVRTGGFSFFLGKGGERGCMFIFFLGSVFFEEVGGKKGIVRLRRFVCCWGLFRECVLGLLSLFH